MKKRLKDLEGQIGAIWFLLAIISLIVFGTLIYLSSSSNEVELLRSRNCTEVTETYCHCKADKKVVDCEIRDALIQPNSTFKPYSTSKECSTHTLGYLCGEVFIND